MTRRLEGGFQPQPVPGQEGVVPTSIPAEGLPIVTSSMGFRPITGEIDATGCGAHITYRANEDLTVVTFLVKPNPAEYRSRQPHADWEGRVVVYDDGRVDVTGLDRDACPDGVHFTLRDMHELRRFAAILTWCSRTAYAKVFSIRNVDQIPFK